jgi:dTDP-4-amino-4,6-dideoxygalactose transaminase
VRHLRHQLAAHSPVTLTGIVRAAFGAGAQDRDALVEILRREFETEHVSLVDSGTHALQLAIEAAISRSGQSPVVALPAFGCFDLATAVIPTQAKVVFYDVDPATLSPDVESLEWSFAQGARVAVITPLYGMPVDWDLLQGIASRWDATLIEDSAQGHGAAWKGRRLGSFGELAVLSFSRGKGWTGGYGGALLRKAGRRSEHPMKEAPSTVSTVLRLAAHWALGRPSLYGVPRSIPALALGETVFHDPTPVRELGAGAVSAILATRQNANLESQVRRATAQQLVNALEASPFQPAKPLGHATPGYLRLAGRLRGGMSRFRSRPEAERLGIAGSYPRLLRELPGLSGRIVAAREYRGAEELVADLITLPTHSMLRNADFEAVVAIVASS